MNRQSSLNRSGSSLRSGFHTKFRLTWAIWFLLVIHALVVLAGFVAPLQF